MEDAKRAKERGMTYERDMAGPTVKHTDPSIQVFDLTGDNGEEKNEFCLPTKDNVTGKAQADKKQTKCTESLCATCGEKGHLRNTHKDCLKSTNTKSRFFCKYYMCKIFFCMLSNYIFFNIIHS